MIGFFDSGLGGLTVIKEAVNLLPKYSYVYLGDNARTPYGSRSRETIYRFTVEGVEELFRRGAELVVLACNTSSSSALRKIQREFLAKRFPEKKVLGIIVPTVEEIAGQDLDGRKGLAVGVLATEATVKSLAYPKEIRKINPAIKVHQEACPLLAPIIEAGEIEWDGLDSVIQKHLARLFLKNPKIDTILLGCTHYAIIENRIRRYVPARVKIVSQGQIIASKLKDYLRRHPEIESKLLKTGERIFLTTDDSKRVKFLTRLFYGEPIDLEKISIGV